MWTFTDDWSVYARHVEPYLLTDPVANTVALTVLAGLSTGTPLVDRPSFGWWTEQGEVRGAVYRTPPFPLGLTRLPAHALPALLDALADRDIPAVTGPRPLAEAVAAALRLDHPRVERLYGLRALAAPQGVPGSGRAATAEDHPLLTEWTARFSAEAGVESGPDASRQLTARVARGDTLLWQDGGTPVAMADLSPEAGGVRRVRLVYTPPPARGRGYGSAVTAYAGGIALDRGADRVVLFADLSNPTSNKIYQAIGFEPVMDYVHFSR